MWICVNSRRSLLCWTWHNHNKVGWRLCVFIGSFWTLCWISQTLDRSVNYQTNDSGRWRSCLWICIISHILQAIVALTFAEYAAKPFFPDCAIPQDIVKLLAALCLCLLTAINCMSTKVSMKVQDIFTAGKLIALVSIIFMGVIAMFTRDTTNFDNVWTGKYESKNICYAFMQGMFAFGGWNYLNFVTGELQDPYRWHIN